MTDTEVTGRAAPAVPQWDTPDRLRKSLRHAGLESGEMAEYLEVTHQTISNWINGRTRPPAAVLRLWAWRCNVPYEWLARGETLTVTTAGGDYGPPALTNPDIPSGIAGYANMDHTELVRDFRKRLARIDATRIEEAAA